MVRARCVGERGCTGRLQEQNSRNTALPSLQSAVQRFFFGCCIVAAPGCAIHGPQIERAASVHLMGVRFCKRRPCLILAPRAHLDEWRRRQPLGKRCV